MNSHHGADDRLNQPRDVHHARKPILLGPANRDAVRRIILAARCISIATASHGCLEIIPDERIGRTA